MEEKRHRDETGTAGPPQRERAAMSGTSPLVRLARVLYALLSSVFFACILVQVFFAGVGAFGADWDWHLTFVHLFGALPVLMIPVAFVGRMSWGSRLLPSLLVVMIGVQYATANSAVPAAAVHPVNALLIFWVGLLVLRRAWSTVGRTEQRVIHP
jgi:hypothetical protein